MIYHGFKSTDPDAGRMVWLSRIVWADGWPLVVDNSNSNEKYSSFNQYKKH